MRIVAVADTHTNERRLGAVPDGDVLIHAGDLLKQGTVKELARFCEWFCCLPHAVKIVVAGNDDRVFMEDPLFAQGTLGPGVTYLQDSGVSVDGVTFWGSPWQPAGNGVAFGLPKGRALREKWALVPEGTAVLITHFPPRGIGDRSRTDNIGCDDLRAAAQRVRPALHVFGHTHAAGGFWRIGGTCFSNVTTWNGQRQATVLNVDPHTLSIREITVQPSGLVPEPGL
jgi:predicted phosphodiesterase